MEEDEKGVAIDDGENPPRLAPSELLVSWLASLSDVHFLPVLSEAQTFIS